MPLGVYICYASSRSAFHHESLHQPMIPIKHTRNVNNTHACNAPQASTCCMGLRRAASLSPERIYYWFVVRMQKQRAHRLETEEAQVI